jgi:lipid-binding SYLF domain-containing protein
MTAMNVTRRSIFAATLAVASVAGPLATPAHAQPSAANLVARSRQALDELYATAPRARMLGRHARAVLVFPSIIKGGLVWGAESGDGVLFVGGRPQAFYNISAASFGLQAGGQKFSSAMFFMNGRALGYLDRSAGFAIGSAPNVVVIDRGEAMAVNTTTVSQDVYVVPFGQRGLMAGIDIHGSKITRIHPD